MWALANPQVAREQLDTLECEESLYKFMQFAWPLLTPAYKMIKGWVLEAMCEHLEAITRGEIKKLLINVPPGTAKSSLTGIMWPMWEWGPRSLPHMRIINASYSESLPIGFNQACMRLVRSEEYQRRWGSRFTLDPDQQSKHKFDNLSAGWKLATSVGGSVTGARGDRVIIDDPHNVKESESIAAREEALQWFTEVLPTRINNPDTSAMLCIMQRVSERDISGHILSHDLGWDHLCLPMHYDSAHPHRSRTALNWTDPRKEQGELLWPERFSAEYLKNDLEPSMRSWGGEYSLAGQLEQRPAPRGGGMFKEKWFTIIESKDLPRITARVRGWDLASTEGGGAYTVGALLGKDQSGNTYVEDVRRQQWSSSKVYGLIESTAKHDGHSVTQDLPQDPGQAGKAQREALAKLLEGYTFHITTESGSKEDRAKPLAAQAESGRVFLVRAPWNEAYIDEMCTFPAGHYMDQVDASTRAYHRLLKKKDRRIGGAGIVVNG